jgi:DNA (cytosine-5)-methyltransferase 1
MRELGYTVDYRVLTAADYGDPTTRRRLFVIARKRKPMVWAQPTHHRHGGDLFVKLPRWRTAREVIDRTIRGKSIYDRSTPLAEKTMKRIKAGLAKFRGEPFLIEYYGNGQAKSIDEPLPTVTSRDRFAFVEPIIRAGKVVDILLRMLKPHELAAAMSYPKNYQFQGTKDDKVKQIGNAVPIELAKNLSKALLSS